MAYPSFIAASHASYNGSGSATITCSYPAGTSTGDLLIMFGAFGFNSTATTRTMDTPAGWTELDDVNRSTQVRQFSKTYYRFAGAETDVTLTASSSSGMKGTAQIFAFTAASVDSSNPVSAHAMRYDTLAGSSAARATPDVTTPTSENVLCWFAYCEMTASRTHVWSGSTTERIDHFAGTTADSGYTSATENVASPSTNSQTADPSGSCNEYLLAGVAVQPPQILFKSSTDAGSSADSSAGQTVSGSADTGVGAGSSAVRAYAPSSDAGSGVDDPAASLRVRGSDAVAGAGSAKVRQGVVEGVAGSDSSSVRANTFGVDGVGGSDVAVAAAHIQADDVAGVADSASVRLSGLDAGTSVEGQLLADADMLAADTGTTSETSRVRSAAVDVVAGADDAFASNTAVSEDLSTSSDAAKVTVGVSDTVSTVDAAAPPPALTVGSEVAAAVDTALVIVWAAADPGSGVDAGRARQSASDTGSFTDASILQTYMVAVDTVGLVDVAFGVLVAGAVDEAAGFEHSFRIIPGQIIGRQRAIESEDRSIVVPVETRTVTVVSEVRESLAVAGVIAYV